MKKLKDHNNQYLKDHKFPTGIECPVCKKEMFFSNPTVVISQDPYVTMIYCPSCGFIGARNSIN